MKNIYGIANTYKTKEDRLSLLTTYRRNLIKLLKEGFDPFGNNTQLLEKRKNKTDLKITIENNSADKNIPIEAELPVMTIKEALDFALNIKKRVVNDRTYKSYAGRSKNFINWLDKNYATIKTIDQLSKMMVMAFLNTILQDTSARNRNNFRVGLATKSRT